MEKINIAELLKDCPKGMELDCTCADNVVFDKIIEYEQIKCVIGECRDPLILDKYGRLLHICCPKCVIFPKGKTTWEGFQRPFKDGDVVISEKGDIHLLRTSNSSYCAFREQWEDKFDYTITTSIKVVRLATEEEKQKLFDAIKANGYKWNAKIKTLEKLKKEYPKTYEECCMIIGFDSNTLEWDNPFRINRDTHPYIKHLDNLIESFLKLLICRNAYWKIAGEEMGLGISWEPDFNSGHFTPAIVFQNGFIQKVEVRYRNTILAFPTTEMRNDFSEHFKKDIEQCKEFL